MGKDGAKEIVHFTLANVEALIKLNEEELSPEIQKAGEVRRVETMNVFTTEQAFAEFSGSVKLFDEAFPEFRGRGRLVDVDELKTVSLVPFVYVCVVCADDFRNMGYTMPLERI